MDYNDQSLKAHSITPGKLRISTTLPLENRDQLCIAYTPGVAAPCCEIQKNPQKVYDYTIKSHFVAVVTDGTAVLGLGDIGPLAAMPVMEGKAALFKQFGDIDAIPICLNTTDTDAIIQAVKAISPTFGGINLEDIASPKCFEIEDRLEQELDIPVFHDDQHGTAIVVTAALINAAKLVGKPFTSLNVVLNGPGAAGTAIIKMLLNAGISHIIACDEHGILEDSRPAGLKNHKINIAKTTNPTAIKGDLSDALTNADVFIGVSAANLLTPNMIALMAKDPIVFAMANPVPEISYQDAKDAGVKVMGTGRSDSPNQINNLLAFPGVFKGALRARARNITPSMKVAAANAIAAIIPDKELSEINIIPSVFHENIADAVADAVEQAWLQQN